jgi:hypothetical protein
MQVKLQAQTTDELVERYVATAIEEDEAAMADKTRKRNRLRLHAYAIEKSSRAGPAISGEPFCRFTIIRI